MRVTAMGAKYKRTDVEVARQIGEGSFGVVYQGKIDARRAEDVVLKRPKLTVEGAAELQEVEAWMNDRVSRDARGACADFLGSFRVTPDEAYINASEGVVALSLAQRARVLVEVIQADYDPLLFVRSACDDANAELGCNDDFNELLPRVQLNADAGTVYIFIEGFAGGRGAGVLQIDVNPF